MAGGRDNLGSCWAAWENEVAFLATKTRNSYRACRFQTCLLERWRSNISKKIHKGVPTVLKPTVLKVGVDRFATVETWRREHDHENMGPGLIWQPWHKNMDPGMILNYLVTYWLFQLTDEWKSRCNLSTSSGKLHLWLLPSIRHRLKGNFNPQRFVQ